MNPFEIERLGWDQIRGLPLLPDPELGTGRFRIVCSRDLDGEGLEEVEAIGQEVGAPAQPTFSPHRTGSEGGQKFQKSSPTSESELCSSALSRVSSSVQIRMPIAIRITPPIATISW